MWPVIPVFVGCGACWLDVIGHHRCQNLITAGPLMLIYSAFHSSVRWRNWAAYYVVAVVYQCCVTPSWRTKRVILRVGVLSLLYIMFIVWLGKIFNRLILPLGSECVLDVRAYGTCSLAIRIDPRTWAVAERDARVPSRTISSPIAQCLTYTVACPLHNEQMAVQVLKIMPGELKYSSRRRCDVTQLIMSAGWRNSLSTIEWKTPWHNL